MRRKRRTASTETCEVCGHETPHGIPRTLDYDDHVVPRSHPNLGTLAVLVCACCERELDHALVTCRRCGLRVPGGSRYWSRDGVCFQCVT
jgi:hypothetical protein